MLDPGAFLNDALGGRVTITVEDYNRLVGCCQEVAVAAREPLRPYFSAV